MSSHTKYRGGIFGGIFSNNEEKRSVSIGNQPLL
jgi:hypothetical protein